MSKTAAQLEQELAEARAKEREDKRAADEAERQQGTRRKARDTLQAEIDNRKRQIENTLVWIAERRADVTGLEQRLATEFADL